MRRISYTPVFCGVIALLSLPLQSLAAPTIYYVDSAATPGNDGKTRAKAFKTISQVNNASLAPGDMVLFKCGDYFSTQGKPTAQPSSNGMPFPRLEAKNGVTYSSYAANKDGENACTSPSLRPKLIASINILEEAGSERWSLSASRVYKIKLNNVSNIISISDFAKPQQGLLPLARHPNKGAGDYGPSSEKLKFKKVALDTEYVSTSLDPNTTEQSSFLTENSYNKITVPASIAAMDLTGSTATIRILHYADCTYAVGSKSSEDSYNLSKIDCGEEHKTSRLSRSIGAFASNNEAGEIRFTDASVATISSPIGDSCKYNYQLLSNPTNTIRLTPIPDTDVCKVTPIKDFNYSVIWSINPGIIEGGYSLTGKQWMLDSPGEWYFDSTNKELYFYSFDSNPPPSSLRLTTSRIDTSNDIISVGFNADNVKIRNLQIGDAIAHGVGLYEIKASSLNTEFNNMHFYNIEGKAILSNWDNNETSRVFKNIKISNSSFLNIKGSGIELNNARATISNNTFENIGQIGIKLLSPRINSQTALESLINNNSLKNIGSTGISFYPLTHVYRNTVTNACMSYSDCGAIYSNGVQSINSALDRPMALFSKVAENFVINTPGATDGNILNSVEAKGIYLDDWTESVEVTKNFITKSSGNGLNLNKAKKITITGNIISDSGLTAIGSGSPGEITINDNILVANKQGSVILDIESPTLSKYQLDPDVNSASYPHSFPLSLTNNKYYSATAKPFVWNATSFNGRTTLQMNLEQWNNSSSWIGTSIYNTGAGGTSAGQITYSLPTYGVINDLTPTQSLINMFTPMGISVATPSNPAECLNSSNSCIRIDSSNNEIAFLVSSDQASSIHNFDVKTGENYLISFAAKASMPLKPEDNSGSMLVPSIDEYDSTRPWRGLSSVDCETVSCYGINLTGWAGKMLTPLTNTWQTYVIPMNIYKTNASKGRLNFVIFSKNGSVWIDNLKLLRVSTSKNGNLNQPWVRYNNTSTVATAKCPLNTASSCSGYVDMSNGNALTSTYPIPPYSAKVFNLTTDTWKDSDFDGISDKGETPSCLVSNQLGRVNHLGCLSQ